MEEEEEEKEEQQMYHKNCSTIYEMPGEDDS